MDVDEERDVSATAQLVVNAYRRWNGDERRRFMSELTEQLEPSDLVALSSVVESRLKCDFISNLPEELASRILSFLDHKSLATCEQVCKSWQMIILAGPAWQRLFLRRLRTTAEWQDLCTRVGVPNTLREPLHWKLAYAHVELSRQVVRHNWLNQNYDRRSVRCNSDGVYCLQYDDQKIVSGNRDNNIKIWDLNTLALQKTMSGHAGSVLCLQYDDDKIISGSSDSTVRVWRHDGTCVRVLKHHHESVLHLRFLGDKLVTCSKDKTLVIWKDFSDDGSYKYEPLQSLHGHRAAVNVVEFDERYVVSASGDRTARVWDTSTGEHLHTLRGHDRGIACLQYSDDTVVTGSSDQSIRVWDVTTGALLRTLQGHHDLVRCVRFNKELIISGSYDNTIRVWSFATGRLLCILQGHTNRVFRLQFDMMKVISSSQDDTIAVWDFGKGLRQFVLPSSSHA